MRFTPMVLLVVIILVGAGLYILIPRGEGSPFGSCYGIEVKKSVSGDFASRTATWYDSRTPIMSIVHKSYWDRQEWYFYGADGNLKASHDGSFLLLKQVELQAYLAARITANDHNWFVCAGGSVDET